jgi:transposase-like protein
MPITANHPFKGRPHTGRVDHFVRALVLRYPLSYEHITELMSERGVEVDAGCIWR